MKNTAGIRQSFTKDIKDIFTGITIVNNDRDIMFRRNLKLGYKKLYLRAFVAELAEIVQARLAERNNIGQFKPLLYRRNPVFSRIRNL